MKTKQVLVVDDEAPIRMLLRDTLEQDGYEVTEAVDGKDGYEQFVRQSFDIVFTALKMPRMTGSQLSKLIKHDSPATMVIVLTGHGGIDSAREALRDGCDDFLLKPLPSISMVAHAIERCFTRQEAYTKAISISKVSQARDQIMSIAWEELEKNFAEMGDSIEQMKTLAATGEPAKAIQLLDDLAESFTDAQRVLEQLENARGKLASMDGKGQ